MSEQDHTAARNTPASASRSIDDVSVSRVVVAESFDDVRDVLKSSASIGNVVIPWGGGTMMGLGNVPEAASVALDLTRLDKVVTYEPDDLTISVQAGCRAGDLNRLLGEHGQMLPFDAADAEEATIGGLYCTAVSGPRRFGHGSMRDLVIGITVMAPDGEIARGGGMVVKNVSGYDMMRLHYGALGSLGIVLQLNFKVLPAPRAVRTVVSNFHTLDEVLQAVMSVRESPLSPTMIVALNQSFDSQGTLVSAPWRLVLRAEGPEGSVDRQAERLLDATYVHSIEQFTLDDTDSSRVLEAINGALSADPARPGLSIRFGIPPSTAGEAIPVIETLGKKFAPPPSIMADLGSGAVFANWNVQDDDFSGLRAIWEGARGLGTHATMLTGPVAVKSGTDVFGNEPAGFELMRALKRQFDPARVLNRGRFIGHL